MEGAEMTRDVFIKIKGLQLADGPESEEMEVITSGVYYEKDGISYVKYDEVMEGFDGTIRNLLKFSDEGLEVTKRGITNVHMVFEENKKNDTYYSTPFGDLLVGISTARIKLLRKEEKISIHVDYALEINCEPLADCKITIEIQFKDEKEAHLLS